MTAYNLWIDGKAREGAADMPVLNPATEDVFATIARSDEALAEQAIASACVVRLSSLFPAKPEESIPIYVTMPAGL